MAHFSLLTTVTKWFIWLYQRTISPLIGSSCRFYPSCSEYALEALNTHPFWRALWLIIKRLVRCAPWCKGGVDLVPPSSTRHSSHGDQN